MNTIKVLQVGADNIGHGGRSTIAFNLTNNMDPKKISNDFLAFEKIDDFYRKKVKDNGGKIVYLGSLTGNKFKRKIIRLRRTFNLLKQEKYDVLHVNADNALEAYSTAIIGKLAGIQKILIHAHAAGESGEKDSLKNFLIKICRMLIKSDTYKKVAVSKESAEYMFGSLKGVHIVQNGVDIEKYTFNPQIRKKQLQKMDIENDFVIGCVARLTRVKNLSFLIEIFNDILDVRENSILILVGDGELLSSLKKQVKKYKIEDKVLFLGNQKNVNEIMQAFDVFVLPSFHEGLGLVNIEAQASGLPCVVSTGIPKAAKVLDNFTFLSLKDSKNIWVNKILELQDSKREDTSRKMLEAGYDIKNSAKKIEEMYA
ncbi:glycosyltransferase [Pediococcus acidilactici]|uniref:glycosyltransferase n=1 Tax=Pediococcus acidilactici TaxID=1254 RepID=UPI002F265CFF